MRVAHTPTSRYASIATALLVLVQLVPLVAGHHDLYLRALLLTLVLVTAGAALKMHRDNCAESRVAVSLLAVMSGTGVALAMTMGLPGQVVRPLDLVSATVLVLSSSVVVLFAVDQARRTADRHRESPYAL
ncbi:MAG: hypothetical protein ABWX74_06845 [Aeromicrobium sp.]